MDEIDLRGDVLPRHERAFGALRELGNVIPINQWCLVGGLMVLINERRAGRPPGRAGQTKDADIVVDVTAKHGPLERVTGVLRSAGFSLADEIGSGDRPARCSFIRHSAHIDVLGPSNASEEHS